MQIKHFTVASVAAIALSTAAMLAFAQNNTNTTNDPNRSTMTPSATNPATNPDRSSTSPAAGDTGGTMNRNPNAADGSRMNSDNRGRTMDRSSGSGMNQGMETRPARADRN